MALFSIFSLQTKAFEIDWTQNPLRFSDVKTRCQPWVEVCFDLTTEKLLGDLRKFLDHAGHDA